MSEPLATAKRGSSGYLIREVTTELWTYSDKLATWFELAGVYFRVPMLDACGHHLPLFIQLGMPTLPDPQANYERSFNQSSSDGRGGPTRGPMTNKEPRYLYYRLYTKNGPIETNNPIYVNDPVGRTLSKFITPPHTVALVKKHVYKLEGFPGGTTSTLYESISSQTPIEESTRLSIRGNSGPGLSEHDPIALVVGVQDAENRSAPTIEQPKELPHAKGASCDIYYRLYNEEGATTSKMSFDANDDTLGRIDVLSVPPPQTVASLKLRIVSAEGVPDRQSQLFEDVEGELALMNDNDHLSLLRQVYPGQHEDDPMAAVLEEHQKGARKDQFSQAKDEHSSTFLTPIRATHTINEPSWLPITQGETLFTDNLKTRAGCRTETCLHDGYIAVNSAGTKGFVQDCNMTFC